LVLVNVVLALAGDDVPRVGDEQRQVMEMDLRTWYRDRRTWSAIGAIEPQFIQRPSRRPILEKR
jgi:hypothetical protein